MAHEHHTHKEVEVDGNRYLITHPQVETAWDVGVEISKIIGEPISSMATAGNNESSAAGAMVIAVRSFLSKLDSKSSWILIKKILSSVELQGPVGGENKKIVMNEIGIKTHFQGKTGSMLKLVGETISFTHEDFFDAIVSGVAEMMKKTAEKTP